MFSTHDTHDRIEPLFHIATDPLVLGLLAKYAGHQTNGKLSQAGAVAAALTLITAFYGEPDKDGSFGKPRV